MTQRMAEKAGKDRRKWIKGRKSPLLQRRHSFSFAVPGEEHEPQSRIGSPEPAHLTPKSEISEVICVQGRRKRQRSTRTNVSCRIPVNEVMLFRLRSCREGQSQFHGLQWYWVHYDVSRCTFHSNIHPINNISLITDQLQADPARAAYILTISAATNPSRSCATASI